MKLFAQSKSTQKLTIPGNSLSVRFSVLLVFAAPPTRRTSIIQLDGSAVLLAPSQALTCNKEESTRSAFAAVGERIRLPSEDPTLIDFHGILHSCNGCNILQTADCACLSAESHLRGVFTKHDAEPTSNCRTNCLFLPHSPNQLKRNIITCPIHSSNLLIPCCR